MFFFVFFQVPWAANPRLWCGFCCWAIGPTTLLEWGPSRRECSKAVRMPRHHRGPRLVDVSLYLTFAPFKTINKTFLEGFSSDQLVDWLYINIFHFFWTWLQTTNLKCVVDVFSLPFSGADHTLRGRKWSYRSCEPKRSSDLHLFLGVQPLANMKVNQNFPHHDLLSWNDWHQFWHMNTYLS